MIRRLGLVIVLLLGSSCGGGPSRTDLVAAYLKSNPDSSEEDASCMVARLADDIGEDELEQQLEAQDPTPETVDHQLDAMLECGMDTELHTELADSFVRANDVDHEVAGCVMALLVEDMGTDGVVAEIRRASASAEFAQEQFRALFACGDTRQVEAALREQLVEQGTAAADAPCVAEELTSNLDDADLTVLLTGTITDAFYTKFFQAMRNCGAVEG